MALLRMLTFRRVAAGSERPDPIGAAPEPAVGRGVRAVPDFGTKAPPPKPYAVSEPKARDVAAPARAEPRQAEAVEPGPAPAVGLSPAAWTALALRLGLRGPARELAHNAALVALRGSTLQLALKPQHEQLRNPSTEAQLREALAPHLGAVKIEFRVAADAAADSAAEQLRREREARLAAAEAALGQDPVLNALINEFDARVVPGTVRAAE
jgi:DNA polymerase-3 subunit gamma/tau